MDWWEAINEEAMQYGFYIESWGDYYYFIYNIREPELPRKTVKVRSNNALAGNSSLGLALERAGF